MKKRMISQSHYSEPRSYSSRVHAACANCKAKHARCSNHRPCQRCQQLGLPCVSKPNRKTTHIKHVEKKTKTMKKFIRKEKRIVQEKETKLSHFDIEQALSQFQLAVPENPDEQTECIPEPVPLEPMYLEIDHLCKPSEKTGVIYALGEELPNFRIMSPALRHFLGYSAGDEEFNIERIFSPSDAREFINGIIEEQKERSAFEQVNGRDVLLKYCMETTNVERKLVYQKDGEPVECVIKIVKRFSREDPVKLENVTMFIYWV